MALPKTSPSTRPTPAINAKAAALTRGALKDTQTAMTNIKGENQSAPTSTPCFIAVHFE